MAVWPVDYGAETSAGVSLQPVSDSVFARGYKEKDGEQADSRGKKHAYVMEKARAGRERLRDRRGEGCSRTWCGGGGRRVKRAAEGSTIIREREKSSMGDGRERVGRESAMKGEAKGEPEG